MGNGNLLSAKKRRNDEFYTRYEDIEKEMAYYKDQLKGKVIYCNCDDYRKSNFINYFKNNFHILWIKKLLASNYDIGEGAYCYEFNGRDETVTGLEGSGDFRSEECIEFLKEADVVVTNPPFSLFREYVKQLMDYGKKFIIIGNMNAITYKEIFPYLKDNEMWLGGSGIKDMAFKVPSYYEEKATRFWIDENGQHWRSLGNGCWFTNVEHKKRHIPIDLYKRYSNEYKHYDNYDAIECGKVAEIPMDYDGVIGVPITFLDKYCPEQFEIVDARDYAYGEKQKSKNTFLIKDADGVINGKPTYARICIKRVF